MTLMFNSLASFVPFITIKLPDQHKNIFKVNLAITIRLGKKSPAVPIGFVFRNGSLEWSQKSFCKFKRFCLVTAVCLMLSGLIEHLCYEFQLFWYNNHFNQTFSEVYVTGLLPRWNPIVSSRNTFFILFLTLMKKIGTFSWVFGNVIVIILCRSLACLIETHKCHLNQVLRSIHPQTESAVSSKLETDHVTFHSNATFTLELLDLFRLVHASFLSPLVLICQGVIVNLVIVHVTSFTFIILH